jgi:hypothetical protein
MRGGGGEEDAVTIVAGGKEASWFGWQGSEEWKTVGSCWPETGPGFELRGVGERWKQCGGKGVQMSDVGGVNGLVEAGLFYCCSDDGAADVGAGGAGDYIDVRCANDELKWK